MTEDQSNLESRSNGKLRGMAGIATRVRCEGFICMAYLDTQGVWRNFYTKEALPPVLEILSEEN